MGKRDFESAENERILPEDKQFTPEFLDAVAGILLQTCEEVGDSSFTGIVMNLMKSFDGQTGIDPSQEPQMIETLLQMRKSIGLNTYCLLRGLISLQMRRKNRARQWFSLIALNSFSGHEYKIYEMIVGGRMN